MFEVGMHTSDLEQESGMLAAVSSGSFQSRSTHATSFAVIAFWLCGGFPTVASPALWDHGTETMLTRRRRSSRRNDPLMRLPLATFWLTSFNSLTRQTPIHFGARSPDSPAWPGVSESTRQRRGPTPRFRRSRGVPPFRVGLHVEPVTPTDIVQQCRVALGIIDSELIDGVGRAVRRCDL
jgi:hypothetical protein